MSGKISSFSNVIEVTPTVSTSPAYTAEDQVGGIQTLGNACRQQGGGATLISVAVHDKAKQSAALVLFFFDELPTVASSDNAAVDVTDAEMAGKCLGSVTVAATNYVNVSGSSMATVNSPNTALYMKSQDADGKLYVVVKTTGTPTYASTSDLTFRYSFIQD